MKISQKIGEDPGDSVSSTNKTPRDRKRFGRKGGRLCHNVLKRKQGSNELLDKPQIQAAR